MKARSSSGLSDNITGSIFTNPAWHRLQEMCLRCSGHPDSIRKANRPLREDGLSRHLNRNGAPPVHAFEQQRKLRRGHLEHAIDNRRPHEPVPLQLFCKKAQARAVPVQNLDVVAALAAKNEQMTGIGIVAQHIRHLRGQAVETLAHVRRPARQIYLRARSRRDHHGSAVSTRRNAFSSTWPSTRTTMPPGITISIKPAAGRTAIPFAFSGTDKPGRAARSSTTLTGMNPESPTPTRPPFRNCLRHVNTRFALMSCRRATIETDAPGSSV